jgi:hypothetical protein
MIGSSTTDFVIVDSSGGSTLGKLKTDSQEDENKKLRKTSKRSVQQLFLR